MYYAGYGFLNTDVAVFETAWQRDNWVNQWSVFERIPLSAEEVWLILDGMPDYVKRETDILDESIVWLINPYHFD